MATKAKTATPTGQQQLARLAPAEGLQHLLAQQRQQLFDHYTLFLQQGGEEALHDFRVSLRRLRSLLRNYQKFIECDEFLVGRLRELQRQTNLARDLEVFIAQLNRYCPEQGQLISALQQQLQGAYRQLQHELPPQWAALFPLIRFSLSPSTATTASSLGHLTAHLGKRQIKQLNKGLRSLQQHWDESLLHRLRIRGKRLRYLLEPLAEEAGYLQTVEVMKDFQDTLGDYRDLQLLLQYLSESRAEKEGLTVQTRELLKSLAPQWRQQTGQVKRYAKRDRQKGLIKSLRYALHQLDKH